jgi:hypothetical protein
MRRTNVGVLVISIAFGCGGASVASQTALDEPPAGAPDEDAEVDPSVTERDMSGRILRAELDPVLEAGLGRFLQGIETEPELEGGRFVGFRLVSIYPQDERLSGVELEPGDVVLRVNGQRIERPEQALQVWNGLRVASELWIEYRRGDETRELRFEIVE